MELIDLKEWPVLLVDDDLDADTAEGRVLRRVVDRLEEDHGCTVIDALSCADGHTIFSANAGIGCVVVEWEVGEGKNDLSPTQFITEIRERNTDVPVFLLTDKLGIKDIPTEVLGKINGYIWKTEDTPSFIAGRIEAELKKYVDGVMPLFFKELVKYAEEYKYAWHTPGHMGGVAFLKTPAGRACHKFFGENMFRSDLSVSVPELGSLNDHEGVVGEAENEAAKIFGADQTYFVLNGSSTSNQVVWHARITRNEIALVDRNCHKSHNHAMVVTGAIPLYLMPSRNAYGTIGPIHTNEFKPATIQKKIDDCVLIPKENKKDMVKMVSVTNSTYDGLCYNVVGMKDKLARRVENLHFDEAWYAYAKFHPLYENHFGMSDKGEKPNHPPVFATQSTHKLLAAWSQASMLHVKHGGKVKIDRDQFNESYMMHSSTSPQYGMIATLDVAARMMKGVGGRKLMDETIEEPILFRQKMVSVGKDLAKASKNKRDQWWFTSWQPEKVAVKVGNKKKTVAFEDAPVEELMNNQDCWTLKPGESWHGFANMEENYIMLDPIKVTIATPGIAANGKLGAWGIPASVVTMFLINRGVVVEKTGYYSWLLLFSMGITKGKSGTLLAEMLAFKELYDANAPLSQALPNLTEAHPEKYGNMGLKDLCDSMHAYLKKNKVVELMLDSFSELPEQMMTPADAYSQLIKGNYEHIPAADLMDQTAAVQLVPYPPGIPISMPGEKFTAKTKVIVDYLMAVEEFEYQFPGFEGDIHGIERRKEGDRQVFYTQVLK